MGKHGGARAGAGRKNRLQDHERISIGIRCQYLADEHQKQTFEHTHQRLIEPTEIRAIQKAVRRVRDGNASEDDRCSAETATDDVDNLMAELKTRAHREDAGLFARAISIRAGRYKRRQGQSLRN
jgi:hypothetical protein